MITIPFNFNTLNNVSSKTSVKHLEEKLLKRFGYDTKVLILEFLRQSREDLKFLTNYVCKKAFLHYTYQGIPLNSHTLLVKNRFLREFEK